jgi:hypothetical protein
MLTNIHCFQKAKQAIKTIGNSAILHQRKTDCLEYFTANLPLTGEKIRYGRTKPAATKVVSCDKLSHAGIAHVIPMKMMQFLRKLSFKMPKKLAEKR